MPELNRFVRKLVEQLEASPGGMHRSVSLDLVRGTIMPYRTHRRALALDSVEDYETILLRLASGEREYVRTMPPAAAERCRQELLHGNPDLGILDELAEATIQVGAAALARIRGEEAPVPASAPARSYELAEEKVAPVAPPPRVEPPAAPARAPKRDPVQKPESAPAPREARKPPRAMEPVPTPPSIPEPPMASSSESPTQCRSCSKPVPAGRVVVFCPWCGDRLIPFACARCGTELDSAWQHCITCGAEVKDPYHYA